ncbi:MAG: DUF2927 domain-containing protein [Maribacter sp.]
MKKLVLPFLSILVIACSTDADEIIDDIANENPINKAPAVSSQQFQVAEHSPSNTSIGTVSATDAENDELTFTIDSEADIQINETTGELTIGENLKLDFEDQENISFTVSAFDGTSITDANITLNVEDIIEYDILNEEQLAAVNHFKHLALFQDATSPTQEIMRKWNEPMKLFLDGTISQQFQETVETVIEEFNVLTTLTGSFSISLVDTEAESNTKLFFGTKEEMKDVFPVMYEEAKELSVDGLSKASFEGNFYTGGKIWISNPIDVLFKHELGHALGMGHSHLCDAPDPSVMCANIAAESTFLAIEEEVIKFFYHENMPSGLNLEDIDFHLPNLILLEE